jgi:hypothetical protein
MRGRLRRRRELGRGPVAPAVIGGEVGAVGTHGDAADAVRKPEIQQRLLGLGRKVRARPGFATVHRVQDGLVVTDGPAIFPVGEEHGGEHDSRRHALRLPPAGALIVGEQYVAALADGHQPRSGNGEIEQQGAWREWLQFGRLVRLVTGIERSLGAHVAPERRDRQEHCFRFPTGKLPRLNLPVHKLPRLSLQRTPRRCKAAGW